MPAMQQNQSQLETASDLRVLMASPRLALAAGEAKSASAHRRATRRGGGATRANPLGRSSSPPARSAPARARHSASPSARPAPLSSRSAASYVPTRQFAIRSPAARAAGSSLHPASDD